ncbi:MAG: hypothetical protein IPG45_05915 [Deltaproteobacteria bacterium]|nr:hypothetical protein [Deltaproteobacteria bacterium]
MFGASSYVLRVLYNGVTENLTFSVTPNRFYWAVGDGQADAATLGGQGDLLRVLELCIETHSGAPSVTVTLDSNYRLRVAVAANTIQLLWSHASTTLDTAGIGGVNPFGYSGDTSLAAAVVSASMPAGLWRAQRPIWNDGRPQRPMIGGAARTMTGLVRVSDFGTMARERGIYFGRLPQTVVLNEYAPSTALYGTLEYAWHNAIGIGRPFRLYEDEGQLATGTSAYTLWRTTSKARPYQRLSDDPPESLYYAARFMGAEVTS